jgi:hypothetical protein
VPRILIALASPPLYNRVSDSHNHPVGVVVAPLTLTESGFVAADSERALIMLAAAKAVFAQLGISPSASATIRTRFLGILADHGNGLGRRDVVAWIPVFLSS